MKVQNDGYNWLVTLEIGEKLIENLTNLVKSEDIQGAWISGLGAANSAEIGFYDLESKEYKWKNLDQTLEITSLQGNIAWDKEEPVIHLHGTFSDQNMQTFGGHIREIEAAGTVEIFIHKWYGQKLTRQVDQKTGLKLLNN